MKTLTAALALLCALTPAPSQEKQPLPCDLAVVEDALWCPKCAKAREKDQLEGEQCKVCKTATEKLKVCVKKWIPRCGMHEQKPHLDNCCKSKKCCVLEASKSPVVYKCLGCGKMAAEAAKIAHDAKEHDAKTERTCEASGTAPHGGEPIK